MNKYAFTITLKSGYVAALTVKAKTMNAAIRKAMKDYHTEMEQGFHCWRVID